MRFAYTEDTMRNCSGLVGTIVLIASACSGTPTSLNGSSGGAGGVGTGTGGFADGGGTANAAGQSGGGSSAVHIRCSRRGIRTALALFAALKCLSTIFRPILFSVQRLQAAHRPRKLLRAERSHFSRQEAGKCWTKISISYGR